MFPFSSHREKRVLEYLKNRDQDIGASYEEIAKACHITSKSGVHKIVRSLKLRGYIDFIPKVWRSIKVIKND